MREVEQVDDALDGLALRDFGAADVWQKQQLLGQVRLAMPMTAD